MSRNVRSFQKSRAIDRRSMLLTTAELIARCEVIERTGFDMSADSLTITTLTAAGRVLREYIPVEPVVNPETAADGLNEHRPRAVRLQRIRHRRR